MHDTIFTDTHPFQATIKGYMEYRNADTDEIIGAIPFMLTMADNCCEEHAEQAAKAVMQREAIRRTSEEFRFGNTAVTAIIGG